MHNFVESPGVRSARSQLASAVFKYAPPKTYIDQNLNDLPQQSKLKTSNAKSSVYYFYWEFLKRNKNYQLECNRSDYGPCFKLYQAFGNIYAIGFDEWWATHWQLFAEPAPVILEQSNNHPKHRSGYYTAQISKYATTDQINEALKAAHLSYVNGRSVQARSRSQAQYPIYQRPVLATLYRCLFVYDLKQLNPDMFDEDLADIAGLQVSDREAGLSLSYMERLGMCTVSLKAQMRRSKRKGIQRDLRMATRLIANAGKAKFPCTDPD
jgi:hypothetical protein